MTLVIGVGIVLVLLGVIVNIAKHHPRLRHFIERYILGGDPLFKEDGAGDRFANMLGWELILAGVFIWVPSNLMVDGIIVFLAVLLAIRLRREYQRTVRESKDPRHALAAIRALQQREPLVAAEQERGRVPPRSISNNTVVVVLELLGQEVRELRAGKRSA